MVGGSAHPSMSRPDRVENRCGPPWCPAGLDHMVPDTDRQRHVEGRHPRCDVGDRSPAPVLRHCAADSDDLRGVTDAKTVDHGHLVTGWRRTPVRSPHLRRGPGNHRGGVRRSGSATRCRISGRVEKHRRVGQSARRDPRPLDLPRCRHVEPKAADRHRLPAALAGEMDLSGSGSGPEPLEEPGSDSGRGNEAQHRQDDGSAHTAHCGVFRGWKARDRVRRNARADGKKAAGVRRESTTQPRR